MALAGRESAAYLFLSLLQARTGGSLSNRLAGRDVRAVLERPADEFAREMNLTERAARALAELREGFDACALVERLALKGVRVLTRADEGYPARLDAAPDPPPALFVDGRLPEGGFVALAGSRKATRAGVETACGLGRELAARGVCVVSGLALGVDAAAHEGALAAGGATVGVLGCGIDVTYPPKYKPPRDKVPRPADGRNLRATAGLDSRTCVGSSDLPGRNVLGNQCASAGKY